MSDAPLAAFQFLLVSPKSPGNVGAAARALKNMGIERLAIVEPVPALDYRNEEARKLACHALDLLERTPLHASLDEAVSPSSYLVATSARAGRSMPLLTPREAAPDLLRLARDRPVSILFGAEDDGLPNRLVSRANQGLCIPTSEQYRSLNLGQAVLLVAYELFLAALGPDAPAPSGEPATLAELDALGREAVAILKLVDYWKPHNGPRIQADLERLLARAEPRAREVSLLRGICRQIRWLAGRRAQ